VPAPKPSPAPAPVPAVKPVDAPPASLGPSRSGAFLAISDQRSTDEDDESAGRSTTWLRIAAAALLVALVGGGALATRHFMTPAGAAGTGRLVIDTAPAGAQVVVDGQASGTTPVTLTLEAGTHTVELRNGGSTRTLPVTVVAGSEVAQYIELPRTGPAPGQLEVRTEPAGARVSVDGVPRGASPVTVGNLAPGSHAVVLESDAGSSRQTVTVEAGATASLVVQLTPQGVPLSGWIAVTAPAEVQIFEDGRLIGSSLTEQVMVAAGTHQITLANEALGYRSTRSVPVGAGKVSSVKVEFPKGTIAVNATPWAEVWLDGESLGETPIGNVPVVIGPHDLVFRHPDLGEQRHRVVVTATAPAKLSVDMRKQ
jgi:hypothetical protein